MRLFSRRPRTSVASSPAPARTFEAVADGSPPPASSDGGPPPSFEPFDTTLEPRIRELGGELLDAARSHRAGLLSGAFWSDKLMDFTMKDQAFKVRLFRFVDCLPRLKTPEQVHEHLVEYLGRGDVDLPPGLGLGLRAGGLAKGAASRVMTNRIAAMAEKFIAGRDLASALPVLEKLRSRGLAFSVDLLGESVVSPAEADAVRATYLELVRGLPARTATWKDDPRLDHDHLGPVPRANVSIKITALHPAVDPVAGTAMLDEMEDALLPVLEAARDTGCFVNFDMEQHALKDFTLDLFERCCEKIDFHAGMAIQAYLRSGDADARRIADWARRTGRQVTIRLVKGAYWDYQTIHAEMEGVPSPVWGRKRESDACFERMARIFADAIPRSADEGGTKLALGSHNARSIAAALALVERRDLPPNAIELQMLHGMGEELKEACVDRGLRVREYVPVGEMIPGMAYLVRRLLENTSNESWLRAGFADDADASTLVGSPHESAASMTTGHEHLAAAPERHALSPAVDGVDDGRPFTGEPPLALVDPAVRRRIRAAFEGVAARPAAPAPDLAALAARRDLVRSGRGSSRLDRAATLGALAARLRDERERLVADVIEGSGLNWADADLEVRTAIDHVALAARAADGDPRRLGRYVGEQNRHERDPLGLVAIVASATDPLAVPLGLAAPALAVGNAVVLHAGDRPAPALGRAIDLANAVLAEPGRPEHVVFVGGPADDLVRAPIVDAVAGCADGPRLAALAAAHGLGSFIALPRTANAVIVDASADLDEAVHGVRTAAFGHAGMHPLACRRVLVVASAADAFTERLVAASACLQTGDPRDPATDVGPGGDDATRAAALGAARTAVRDTGAEHLLGDLAADVAPGAPVAPIILRTHGASPLDDTPIAAPVLSIEVVDDVETAFARAGAGRPYAVGLYTRRPSSLERAPARCGARLVVLNRILTHARPGRQPLPLLGCAEALGGVGLARAFTRGRTIVESTMRQGFAPDLAD